MQRPGSKVIDNSKEIEVQKYGHTFVVLLLQLFPQKHWVALVGAEQLQRHRLQPQRI